MFAPRPTAVLIDVGFTLTFHDGERIAALAGEAGVQVLASAVHGVEGQLRRELAGYAWPSQLDSAAPLNDGIRFYRRLLELAGADGGPEARTAAAEAIWRGHLRRNVWCRVGPGVPRALERLRAGGLRLGVVSNSEGTIEQMLVEAGLRPYFEVVLDSHVVQVSKPDRRIFEMALAHLGVAPAQAVHVGDSPLADVAGARGAGVQAALLDPHGIHEDCDAPRFSDFASFADAVLQK